MGKASSSPTPIDPIIAELRRVRDMRGLRQQEVADMAGISRRALVSIEAGNDCTLSTLRSLCAALGIDLEARSQGVADVQEARAFSFSTLQAMSDHQAQRELDEAMRVQAMSPAARSRWLSSSWGRLQRQAFKLPHGQRPARGEPHVMHFATLADKNRHDEQREMDHAVRLAMSRG
jgi:transcriptional regulator with XRE-family HTH domain